MTFLLTDSNKNPGDMSSKVVILVNALRIVFGGLGQVHLLACILSFFNVIEPKKKRKVDIDITEMSLVRLSSRSVLL